MNFEKFEKDLDQMKLDCKFVFELEEALNKDDIEDEFVTKKELAKSFDILLRLIEKWAVLIEDRIDDIEG